MEHVKIAVRTHACYCSCLESVYSHVQPTPVVNRDNHALRLNAHHLC